MKVSSEILNLVPYRPGKPIEETKREYGLNKVYKLASNENPLGPSPKVIEALGQELSNLHRYPDASCYQLRQSLSGHFGLAPDNIVAGNGSNEIIDLLIRIYCEPGDSLVTSQAAFIAYKICAQAARVRVHEVPMKEGFHVDLERMSETIEQHRPKLVFLPNPNNPTGTYCTQSELSQFLKKFGAREDLLIIIDEAYFEYVRAADYPSALELQREHQNVLVLRTFSKVYGLAGLRLGVLLAAPQIIDLVNRVRNPFNVNSLAQIAAMAAIKDKEHLQQVQEVTWQGMDWLGEQLAALGLSFVPSQANFLLFDCQQDSLHLYEELLKRGVIVRPVKNYALPTHLRLSVGLPEENQAFIESLKMALKH